MIKEKQKEKIMKIGGIGHEEDIALAQQAQLRDPKKQEVQKPQTQDSTPVFVDRDFSCMGNNGEDYP